MLSAAGWFDEAERVHGAPNKHNGGTNPVAGFIAHSAEGWQAYLRSASQDPHNRKSWHLSCLQNGQLLQHYSVFVQCWASGSAFPNNSLVALEAEGVAGQPLTDAQHRTVAMVIKELARVGNWTPQRGTTLWEHREATRWGSLATACPSGRYDWPLILSFIGDDMSEEDRLELADRRAGAFVARELNWPAEGQAGDGMYRPVSIADDGEFLTIELRKPDRTAYEEPVRFKVRKGEIV